VTIVVIVLTVIAVAILLPLLNRALESWMGGEDTPSPGPTASPTPVAASAAETSALTHFRPARVASV
jgi:hypothetical protein